MKEKLKDLIQRRCGGIKRKGHGSDGSEIHERYDCALGEE